MYQSKGVTFDAAPSQRETDENGFLHVGASHITKATVNPYYGREIPGWQEAGLDPEAVYYGLRDPEELQASLETWAGLPLHIEHHIDSAEEPQKLTRVGAVGTGAVWNPPYVDAPLTVWDRAAIDAIEDGSFRELSCAYRYDPDFTPGSYEGTPYDFIMRNIRGNHVALVEEGRAGPDVVVADSHPTSTKKGTLMGTFKKWFRGAQDDNPDIEKQEVELAQAIIDLHKVDPVTGEIVDITEDEDKAEEIRKLIGELSAKLDPEDVKKLTDSLADLAYSPATGDEAPDDKGTAQDRAFRRRGPRPLTAMDAARIKASAVAEAQEHMRNLTRAVRDVRGLVGELDPLSFDSASDVYGYALEQLGENPRKYPRQAWPGMIDILRKQKATPSVARDAAPVGRMSGSFAGLSNITIAE